MLKFINTEFHLYNLGNIVTVNGLSELEVFEEFVRTYMTDTIDEYKNLLKGVKDIEKYIYDNSDVIAISDHITQIEDESSLRLQPVTYYKWVYVNPDGSYQFPHFAKGVEIQKGKWMESVCKWARDGSGGTYYHTGFHLFESEENALEYGSRYKWEENPNKKVVPCKALGVHTKYHSTFNDVKLARYIKFD